MATLLATTFLLVSSVFFASSAIALDTKNGEGVYIVPGSDINLVSRTSNIPVQIKNAFSQDVTVRVHVQPTNSRVLVPSVVEVTVPALTSVTAKVPVEAVANGVVALRVWLTTFSGYDIGEESLLLMNVNADVELTMLIGFGSVVFILLGLGVSRTLRKNRKKILSPGDEARA